MNIQSVKEFFIPEFSEFEKKVLKVNFVNILITFAITFVFAILSLVFNFPGNIVHKLITILLSPLIALAISPLVVVYLFILYLINIFKVKANKYSNYFNIGASVVLLIFQTLVVVTAYLGSFFQSEFLGAVSGLLMPFMILTAFFVIFVNIVFATGYGIFKFVKNLRGF